jgi:hypothetical protein
VCPLASLGLQVRERSKTLRRSIDIDASMATHRSGNGITPGHRYEVEPSKVQPIRHVDIQLGLFWVNTTRRARAVHRTTTNTFDLPTYNPPPRSSTSLVEIWRSHECLALRQRLPRGPRWPQEGDSTREGASWRREFFLNLLDWERQYHVFAFALVHGGGRHDFWVVCSFSL